MSTDEAIISRITRGYGLTGGCVASNSSEFSAGEISMTPNGEFHYRLAHDGKVCARDITVTQDPKDEYTLLPTRKIYASETDYIPEAYAAKLCQEAKAEFGWDTRPEDWFIETIRTFEKDTESRNRVDLGNGLTADMQRIMLRPNIVGNESSRFAV